MKNLEQLTMLIDFYGKLLTVKQQEILSLYYEQDWSLGEIADEYGVSRQAVHDILKRTEKGLLEYEDKLGLVAKFNAEQEKLTRVINMLEGMEAGSALKTAIKQVIDEIMEIQNG